jgi:exonuclease SbcD
MRFIHFADLHLGVENYNKNLNPDTGLSYCFSDFLSSLDKVVETAIRKEVDLVLFCGDTYKSRDPSPTQQREFALRIKRLCGNNIPCFLLVGNHDLPSASGKANTLEIFSTLEVDNCWVGKTLSTYVVPTKSGRVQIIAIPWLRGSLLLPYQGGISPDEANRRLYHELKRRIWQEVKSLDPEIPTILAAHTSVVGGVVGSERIETLGQELVPNPEDLAPPGVDYVALGHIHKRQVLRASPPMVYPGSLQRIDFGDEGEEKGFYLVELEKGEAKFEFCPVKARPFLTINLDLLPSDSNPTLTIINAIMKENVEDAILRLNLKTSRAAWSLVREEDIHRELKKASYACITKELKEEGRPRWAEQEVEKLTPLEALKEYLAERKVLPEHAQLLLEYGERIIRKHAEQEVL